MVFISCDEIRDASILLFILFMLVAVSALRLVKLQMPSLCETWVLKVVRERVFGTMVMSSSRRWSSEWESCMLVR